MNGYISGGIAGQAQTQLGQPGREISRMEQAQAQLDKAISDLYQAISSLEIRLAPVLAPTKPAEVSKAATEPEPVNVAARTESAARYVAAATSRVGDLLNRLEI